MFGSVTSFRDKEGLPGNISLVDRLVVGEIWMFISHVQYGTSIGQLLVLQKRDKALMFCKNARFSFSHNPFEEGCLGTEKCVSMSRALKIVW